MVSTDVVLLEHSLFVSTVFYGCLWATVTDSSWDRYLQEMKHFLFCFVEDFAGITKTISVWLFTQSF